ncbi:MAG TPA: M56 family metallopeptidase [Thermoanaerobaculia bacterium]|jgi:beta-lactamase regulating signal transducer with metallopeptidase domain/tetratricopeptide (TPR) repeat protein
MNPTLATALHFATDIVLRATVLFAATGILILLLRRRSAAARHFVGTVGLAAALLLPVLAFFPVHLEIPLLPKAAASAGVRPGGVAVLLWAWLLGTLAVGARLAVGWLRLRRITRTAETVRDAEWIEERDAAALRLAVGRAVELKESASVPAAMTAGLLRPLLLIGRAARQWAVERRRVVFLHELAHVKRLDWVSVLVAELAVALYWFHPLAWWLSRRVRRDAERASDDLVLASGIKPSVYAGHLLGIFRSLGSHAHPVAPALAAVRPSHFEERLRAILDPGAARLWQSTGGAGWAAAGLLAATVGVTLVEPAPVRCHASPSVSVIGVGAAAPTLQGAASSANAKPTTSTSAHSRCAYAKAAPAASAVIAPPETLALATASEEPGATAPDAETQSPEVAPEPVPDAVVHAVRSGEALSSSGFGFVKASNKSRSRDGRDWYSRGMGYHHDERYPEAIEAFEKAIEADYREDAASYNIACGYALMGNNDEAFRWLDRADRAGFELSGYIGHDDDLDNLRTDPRWAQLKTRVRAERADSGEARAAATRWERLEGRKPSSGEPYFDLGRELAGAGRYDLAVKAYQGAVERDYRAGTALYNQACAYSLAGDHRAALDSLSKALGAGFDQPDLFRNDDDLDALHGDPEFARLSREAKDLALPGYWTGGWGFHPERGKWREAARRFEDYAQKNPQSGRAWYNLGYASLAAERPEVAAEAFHKALDLGYRKPTTMYNLACAYSHLEQKDVAFDWLFKAIDAGFDEASTIRRDDDLDNLRGDPRYRKALEVARAHERSGESD